MKTTPGSVRVQRICSEGGEAKNRFNESYAKGLEAFLRRIFRVLTDIPEISFDLKNVSEEKERRALDSAIARYRAAKMKGQVGSVKEAYDGLRALRTVFAHAHETDWFSIETVVAARYLPEVFVAAPVWFIERKGESKNPQVNIIEHFCDACGTDQYAYLFQMYNYEPRTFDQFSGRDIMPLPIVDLVAKVRCLFDYLVIATVVETRA